MNRKQTTENRGQSLKRVLLFSLFFALSSFVYAPHPLDAQTQSNPLELLFNVSQSGTITDGESVWYYVRTTVSGPVTVGTIGNTEIDERLVYLFVLDDVTVSAKGKTNANVTVNDRYLVEERAGRTIITQDFTLQLKKGWNLLYLKTIRSGTTITVTYSMCEPSNLRWVISAWSPND